MRTKDVSTPIRAANNEGTMKMIAVFYTYSSHKSNQELLIIVEQGLEKSLERKTIKILFAVTLEK
jgi:hypothetical protein